MTSPDAGMYGQSGFPVFNRRELQRRERAPPPCHQAAPLAERGHAAGARSGRPRVQERRTGAPDADRWPSESSPRLTRTRPGGTTDSPSGTVIGGCPHRLSAVWQRGSHHRDARAPTGTADPQSRIGTVTATTTDCWCRRARAPAWQWRPARSRWRGRYVGATWAPPSWPAPPWTAPHWTTPAGLALGDRNMSAATLEQIARSSGTEVNKHAELSAVGTESLAKLPAPAPALRLAGIGATAAQLLRVRTRAVSVKESISKGEPSPSSVAEYVARVGELLTYSVYHFPGTGFQLAIYMAWLLRRSVGGTLMEVRSADSKARELMATRQQELMTSVDFDHVAALSPAAPP